MNNDLELLNAFQVMYFLNVIIFIWELRYEEVILTCVYNSDKNKLLN